MPKSTRANEGMQNNSSSARSGISIQRHSSRALNSRKFRDQSSHQSKVGHYISRFLKGIAYMHVLYYKALAYRPEKTHYNLFISDCKVVRRDLEDSLRKLMEKHEKKHI